MARPPRIELAGGVYHVTTRGDRRENIYSDSFDRRLWLSLLSKSCERFGWFCHAWCQMNNHYHIVIETPEPNLSAGMQHLNGVYTQHTNRRHQRVGHVFQGRYHAILVEKESHLLELSRYVVLNPVRAGFVEDAGQWHWSSYHAMIGTKPPPPWLHIDWLLSHFGSTRTDATRSYIDFVRAGVGLPPIWRELRGQIYLGSDQFMQRMQVGTTGSPDEEKISFKQPRPPPRPLKDYLSDYPNAKDGMAAAYRSGHFTLKQIAEKFNVHYSTVSRASREARARRAVKPTCVENKCVKADGRMVNKIR
jgi:REP element-mobilizing transposase RayT